MKSRLESDLVDESLPGIGHNSFRGADLEKIVKELSAIDEQKKALTEARADIMVVAKSKGFKPKHIAEALKLLGMEPEKRRDFLDDRDRHLDALGLL